MNNEDSPTTLSGYLRRGYRSSFAFGAGFQMDDLIKWIEKLESETETAKAEAFKHQQLNKELSEKNIELGSELIRKREQVEILMNANSALKQANDILQK